MKTIYPLVQKEFSWLFDPIKDWLQENTIELYAHFVTGGHTPTQIQMCGLVLVCLDYGRGIISGGDFSFASVGNILECKQGDVLIYNPTCYHGTTEFKLHENDEASGRIFFAFFMKKATLHAALLSKALHARIVVIMIQTKFDICNIYKTKHQFTTYSFSPSSSSSSLMDYIFCTHWDLCFQYTFFLSKRGLGLSTFSPLFMILINPTISQFFNGLGLHCSNGHHFIPQILVSVTMPGLTLTTSQRGHSSQCGQTVMSETHLLHDI
jgi:hypothetical protein